MRVPRIRFTVRRMMAVVASLAIAMAGLIVLYRHGETQYRRGMAEYEAAYARACLGRIPDDIRRAFVCGKWAVEGREAPLGFVNSGSVWGMINPAQEYRKLIMNKSLPGVPGARDRFFPGWASESMWWASEAAHDAIRAWWHGSMSRQWELAASDPLSPRPTESPMPCPDF